MTIETSDFTATFTIRVNGIHTTTVNSLQNVIKKVEWTMIGEESGQRFELPQTTDLVDPSPESFVQLAQVTEQDVISWIEANETRLSSIKAHIQFVLDKQVAAAALTSTPMPWAPPAPSSEPI